LAKEPAGHRRAFLKEVVEDAAQIIGGRWFSICEGRA
jgi:hypothetical protein